MENIKCLQCGSQCWPTNDRCMTCGAQLNGHRPGNSHDVNEKVWSERGFVMTTAPLIDGYRIKKTIEIVTAECAFGMAPLRDFFDGVWDLSGGRSSAARRFLRDARKKCLSELEEEALDVGADAIVGVKLDYSELSGKETPVLFLVASGTAIQTAPV